MHTITASHSAPFQSQKYTLNWLSFCFDKTEQHGLIYNPSEPFPPELHTSIRKCQAGKGRNRNGAVSALQLLFGFSSNNKTEFVKMFPHIHTALCSSVYRQQNDSDRLLSQGELAHSSPFVQHLLNSWGYLHCCLRVWLLTNTLAEKRRGQTGISAMSALPQLKHCKEFLFLGDFTLHV